jgi:hexosaminidase
MLEYASERGIQAIIEIDMPGHTNSISYSHPELIAASNIQPDWTMYANQPPSGQLKLNNSDVKNFMATILADILPRTGNVSNYFHTGGDEINVNVYDLDPGINSNASTVIQPYLEEFILSTPVIFCLISSGIHDQIFAANRTPIVWEEMLLQWNVSLNKNVVVQTWQSAANVKFVTAR